MKLDIFKYMVNINIIVTSCIIGFTILLSSCYYTIQGHYLFKYASSGEKIGILLADETTPQDTKDFLYQATDIREYAHTAMTLDISNSYTRYVDIGRDYLVAVVQAAPNLDLTLYTWNYPFMGALPYRGYYRLKDAQKEGHRLKKKGLDVYIRTVSAFSTLNILSDPLYSFMKQYDEFSLAELILHEQVHATIWIKKQAEFNEQLATFLGRIMAKHYIIEKYGEYSNEYKEAEIQNQDSAQFRTILLKIKQSLQTLYDDTNISTQQKIENKLQILRDWQAQFLDTYDKTFTTERHRDVDITKLNNGFFGTITLYEPSYEIFKDALLRCNNMIPYFIDQLRILQNNKQYKKDPFTYLQEIPFGKKQ